LPVLQRRSRMKVPRLVWLQGPWSPVGYDVVESDVVEPAEAATANRPPDRRETPATPWSPLGYRVVEVAPPPSPPVRPRPAQAAPAGRGGPPRHRRRRGRWAALTAGASCLAAVALVLVLARWPARARSVPPAEVAAQEVKSPGARPVAPTGAPDEVWPADRQG